MIATSGAKGMGRPNELVRESIRITRLDAGNVSSLIRRSSPAYDIDSMAPTLVRTCFSTIRASIILNAYMMGRNDSQNFSEHTPKLPTSSGIFVCRQSQTSIAMV